MAMSIGKFNFGALRAADEMAAWIFFVFSSKLKSYTVWLFRFHIVFLFTVVVNMILINMMMAIINLAFEEINENADKFQSKFNLLEYIKRSCREIVGLSVAKPIKPIYSDKNSLGEELDSSDEEERDKTEKTSQEFTSKTDALLE